MLRASANRGSPAPKEQEDQHNHHDGPGSENGPAEGLVDADIKNRFKGSFLIFLIFSLTGQK